MPQKSDGFRVNGRDCAASRFAARHAATQPGGGAAASHAPDALGGGPGASASCAPVAVAVGSARAATDTTDAPTDGCVARSDARRGARCRATTRGAGGRRALRRADRQHAGQRHGGCMPWRRHAPAGSGVCFPRHVCRKRRGSGPAQRALHPLRRHRRWRVRPAAAPRHPHASRSGAEPGPRASCAVRKALSARRARLPEQAKAVAPRDDVSSASAQPSTTGCIPPAGAVWPLCAPANERLLGACTPLPSPPARSVKAPLDAQRAHRAPWCARVPLPPRRGAN